MATRFIARGDGYPLSGTGSQAGIGVDARDDKVYVNVPSSGRIAVGESGAQKGKQWFVDPINGSNGNGGRSWSTAFASLTPLDTKLGNNDFINIRGVLRQQWTAPQDVFDVTIRGDANTPRQATEDGVATGAGATWLAPTSPAATTPLLKLREQGWTVQNIFFSAETDAPCIYLNRLETDAARDPSHFAAYGCVFGGGLYGIQDVGGSAFLQLFGNRFQNFTGSSAYAIRNTSTSIAAPLQWQVVGNVFRNNKNHVVVPMSQAHVSRNDFGVVGNSVTTVIGLSLTGGLNNTVVENYFNRPVNTSPNATLYVGGTNDLWYQNFGTDAVFYGVPDNS